MKLLILDIDETLVHTKYQHQFPGSTPVIDECGNSGYFSMPRPGVHEFLQSLQGRGWHVVSLTQGVVPFQEEVLKTLGLREYILSIYGWANTDRSSVIYPPRDFEKMVMVDNRSMNHPFMSEKENWLGVHFDSTNFIKVQDFEGQDEVVPLLEYLPKIEELLA